MGKGGRLPRLAGEHLLRKIGFVRGDLGSKLGQPLGGPTKTAGRSSPMSRRRARLSRAMDRRRFVGLCAGSLALAAVACRRNGDPAYARGNTLVMAISDVSSV